MRLHTDIPTRGQVSLLFTTLNPACVSIYLPTDPASLGQAERIALKDSPYVILIHDGIVYVHRTDTWKGYIRQPAPDGDPYGNSWLQMVMLEPGEKASTSYSGAPAALVFLLAGVVLVFAFGWWRRRREESGPRELPEDAAR